MLQSHDHANGLAHVAAGANLVANQRDSLFSTGSQPIVMAENLRRDFGAEFGRRRLGVFVSYFLEIEGLKFEKVLK